MTEVERDVNEAATLDFPKVSQLALQLYNEWVTVLKIQPEGRVGLHGRGFASRRPFQQLVHDVVLVEVQKIMSFDDPAVDAAAQRFLALQGVDMLLRSLGPNALESEALLVVHGSRRLRLIRHVVKLRKFWYWR